MQLTSMAAVDWRPLGGAIEVGGWRAGWGGVGWGGVDFLFKRTSAVDPSGPIASTDRRPPTPSTLMHF